MRHILFFILLFLSSKSFCCECYNVDLDTLMKYADFAFIGVALRNISPDPVLSDSLDQEGFGTTVEFKIIKVIKGTTIDNEVIIDQRGYGSCTIGFKLNDQYLVFGRYQGMLPTTADERNSVYLIDDFFNGTSQEEIDTKIREIELFFDELKERRTYLHSDGCHAFHKTSNQFKEIEYSR